MEFFPLSDLTGEYITNNCHKWKQMQVIQSEKKSRKLGYVEVLRLLFNNTQNACEGCITHLCDFFLQVTNKIYFIN